MVTITPDQTSKALGKPAAGPRRQPSRSTVKRVLGWVAFALAVVIAFVWLFPFILVALVSLREFGTLSTDIATWFQGLTLQNFPDAWNEANFGPYLLNSFVITFIKVPLGLLISGLCAFGLSRFRFRGRLGIIIAIVALAAVPIQIALISIFRLELDAGLLNTYLGLILAYLAFGVPFQVVFMVAYFNQIPLEIEESARLDGAGAWRYFFTMILPLSRPLLAALFVLDFVSTWNEFPIALTLLQQQDLWTVPLSLLSFMGPYANDYQLLSATIIMGALPVLIVYLAMQRFFVSGLTAGAVKG